jgi:hypothetical protein
MKNLFPLLVLCIGLLYSCGPVEFKPGSNEEKLLAYSNAESFVKQKLKSPSSAVFPNADEKIKQIEYLGENRYKINSWVESQNSFGAMLKMPFECTIRLDKEKGTVHSEGLKVGN